MYTFLRLFRLLTQTSVTPELSSLRFDFGTWRWTTATLCCQMLVDWVKHAFVTKFNNIDSSTVYVRSCVVPAMHSFRGSSLWRKAKGLSIV